MNFRWENDRLNNSRPVIKNIINFYKENKNDILKLITIGIILYFIFIFVIR